MRAIQPGMSEGELQGIQEYVHKKLGAEYVGYPSIVGAGANGFVSCIMKKMPKRMSAKTWC